MYSIPSASTTPVGGDGELTFSLIVLDQVLIDRDSVVVSTAIHPRERRDVDPTNGEPILLFRLDRLADSDSSGSPPCTTKDRYPFPDRSLTRTPTVWESEGKGEGETEG